jgi:hypothetical protein
MGGSGSDGGRRKRVEVTKGRSERKERRRLLRGGLRKSVREGFLQNFNDDSGFIFFMLKYMLHNVVRAIPADPLIEPQLKK